MGLISEEDIARVREATDVVALVAERVVLKRKGRELWGCCPFHQEKTPSFKVDPVTQLWHCFGCNEGGDAFGYLMQSENLSFPEAVTLLAERANIDITHDEQAAQKRGTREKVFAVCDDTAQFYHQVLTRSSLPAASQARNYLGTRGYGSEVAAQWSLGYAPGHGRLVTHLQEKGHRDEDMILANVAIRGDRGIVRDRFYERVMFPIFNLQGRCCAFGGRILGEGQPKYLNTNDTPVFHKSATMYGLDKARNDIVSTKTALVVEGYTDVIALHEAGHRNTVATLGTALTDQHTKLLSRFAQRIVYVFDGDEAGLRAADRAVEFIDETITPEASQNPMMVDVLMLPAGQDPADLAATEQGIAQFKELLEQAKPLITFAFERRLAKYDLARPEQQMRALDDAAEVLAPIKTSTLAASYARDLADMFAAAGSPIDMAKVMTVVSRTRPVSRRSHDYGQDTRGTPRHTAQTDTEAPPHRTHDPQEIEAIALMMTNSQARAYAKDVVESEMFAAPVLQKIFQVIVDAPDQHTEKALMKELACSMPECVTLFSGYDFESGKNAPPSAGIECMTGVVNAYLERTIRALKVRLKHVSDKYEKQRIIQEIVTLQQRIVQEKQ